MKLKLVLTSFLAVFLNSVYCQVESGKKKAGLSETNRFYYFEIPAVINGSNLDPSAISNISANFSESKLSLKLGFPSLFKNAPKTKDLKNTGFIKGNIKASNGVSTLLKTDNPSLQYGLSGGYSRVLKHTYWTYTDTLKYGKNTHSSEGMTWMNLTMNIEQANYNIFTPNGQYGQIVNKLTEQNGGVFLSVNRYFHSEIKKHKWKRCIASFGIGYAKTNNYSSLKKRTLEDGVLVYNSDSTAYQTVVETTSGAIGELISYEGLASFGEVFIPIIKGKKSKQYGSLYWGNRITYYGIGRNNYIINGSTGFYVNLKDRKLDKTDPDKPAKDVANFSIIAQFNQLKDVHSTDYIVDNFSILLQLSVPLRFN